MTSIQLEIKINTFPQIIFKYLTKQDLLQKWFAPQVIFLPKENTTAAFAFEFDLNFKVNIIEISEPKSMEWQVIEGNPEWINSKIKFEISKQKEISILNFSHVDLLESDKVDKWRESWHTFLNQLANLCEEYAD